MLVAMGAFNDGRSNDAPVRVGIAIHTGGGLLGTVGAGSRRDDTLIGDVVNVAARLEEMNKASARASSSRTIRFGWRRRTRDRASSVRRRSRYVGAAAVSASTG